MTKQTRVACLAALALALVPASGWAGQAATPPQPPAKQAPKPSPTDDAQKKLQDASRLGTEAGRRAVAEERAKEEAAKEKSTAKGGETQTTPPAQPKPSLQDKGDPFALPIKPQARTQTQNLPPGQAGLLVTQINLEGIMRTPNGSRAIIRAPNGHTYFLKVNDKIYNARVTKITEDAIYFEETVVDPLGKTQQREVFKRMPSEGK